MNSLSFKTKMKRLQERMNGTATEYNLYEYTQLLKEIKVQETEIQQKSDDQLKQLSRELVVQAEQDILLTQAYALVREACIRILNLNPYDVQLIGGIVMHRGKLAEMQTGEGKTLSAVFPAYLNALPRKGVHILTFNDYLARRDAEWMGPVYQFLGLSVGFIQEGMDVRERQENYQADITYVTAKEAGFDFLRDGLSYQKGQQVHRPFHFAIVDEADSILIDESRIPLVIAGSVDDHVPDTDFMARVVRTLKLYTDYDFDEYTRNFHLTDAGIKHVELLLKCDNLYASEHVDLLTRLNCALHAELLLQQDVDYIVRDGKIELVDEFTGRVAGMRRWPDGIQAALEAKENLFVQSRGHILNSITLQHFLRLYPKLCGMTATAQSAENELKQFYDLSVVVIPPNKPCVRKDERDVIFKTRVEKNRMLIDEIIQVNRTQRPILVGTGSVEESASLAEALEKQNVMCNVLNAKRNAFEASIISDAGKPGAVTISTNMAGRGTDIKLGGNDETEKERVAALGGLYVIGTNMHESKRIDMQLRGRAGRQGDPGSSRFFISLEDELFVKYHLDELLPPNCLENNQSGAIDNPILRREIDRIQRIVEGQHTSIKQTLFKYSSIIEEHRQILFDRRYRILNDHAAVDFFKSCSENQFKKIQLLTDGDALNQLCNTILLRTLDQHWAQYLAEVADIREGIHLHTLGGGVPFYEFQKIVVEMFPKLLEKIDEEALLAFNAIQISGREIQIDDEIVKTPTATWTYLISDNPFENMIGAQLLGNIGLSMGAGFYGPLMAVFSMFRKKRSS